MSTRQKLSSIKKSNPQMSSDEEIINQFVLRQKPFNDIIHTLDSYNEGTPQHFMVIGQRGMGKSTLLKRIEIELRTKPDLSHRYIPVLLPEEANYPKKLTSFWLRVLENVLDYFDVTDQVEMYKQWESEVEKLSMDLNEEEVYAVFEKIFLTLHKKPVILIDNIQMLFSGLSENENWTLRSRLTGQDAPMLICASPTAPDVFSDYHQAFYDYFKIIHLDPVNVDEFTQLIDFWTNNIGDDEVRKLFTKNRQRLLALYRLSGGNLRTIITLFVKMATGFGEHIEDDLNNLLDEVTEMYKSRMNELSEQLRNIIDAIALQWSPTDLQGIKKHTGFEPNILSPQLKRLRAAGWITTINSKKSKGDKYEMVERFYNIWYIMRYSTRRSKRSIQCLAGFIETFYADDIHRHVQNLLMGKISDNDQLLLHIATSRVVNNTELRNQMENKILSESKNIEDIDPLLKKELESMNKSKTSTSKSVSKTQNSWVTKYLQFINEKKYQECELFLSDIAGKKPKDALIKFALGGLYHFYLKEFQKAEKNYLKAIELDSNYTIFCNNLGNLYQDHLKEYKKAEEAYLKVTELDSNDAYTWNNLGNLYQDHLKEYKKSEKAYLKAIELDPKSARSWNGLGSLYQDWLKEFKKSEKAYLKAIELNPKYPLPWYNLGNLYKNHFKEYIKSEKAYFTAIKLDSNYAYPWNGLGNLYKNLKDYQKSEKAYLKAIKLDSDFTNPWNGLGNLYQDHLKEYKKSEEAYLKAIELDSNDPNPWNGLGNLYQYHLKEYKKSEEAYLKAIELDSNDAHPWNGIGNLYQYHLKEYKKAEEAYLKAIELESNFAYPWHELGNLYQKHLNEYQKSEEAYLKAIELDSNDAYPWNNLGNLYQDYLKEYKKSEDAYLKAIKLDPNYAISWYNLGILYQNHLKEYKKSQDAYYKAIELDPNNAYPWNNLGILYQDYLKEYKKAEDAYLKAIELDSNDVAPWNGLGNLYQNHLKEYKKSEGAYLKAIELDSNNPNPWNGLGNLYQDHKKEFVKAEEAYRKAIEIDGNLFAKYNLVFLLRDKLHNITEAKEIFSQIDKNENIDLLDSYFLNNSLFHIYDLNFGIAAQNLREAIKALNTTNALFTFDDWMRYVVIAIKKGFGEMMLEVFRDTDMSIRMIPLYEAAVALHTKDDFHLNDAAAEVRPIAKDILDKMKGMLE